MNQENKLIASVALFRELYDSQTDIYDIISSFILAALKYESKWSFSSTEITSILQNIFDFNIPESVVKTTLKRRLEKKGTIEKINGLYIVDKESIQQYDTIIGDYERTQGDLSTIFNSLFEFIEQIEGIKLTPSEKEKISKELNAYLLDNRVSDKYTGLISSFILKHKESPVITHQLNTIKEGLVLYSGIRYTSNLNELGSWNYDLTIYLDTEHLFSLMGYNGTLYKQMSDDLIQLVNEINLGSSSKGESKKIQLMYFPEIEEDINGFFYVAEQIVAGKARLNPSKTAMKTIVDGCQNRSDVVNKKTKFFNALNQKGILKFRDIDYYENHSFNIESDTILNQVKKAAEDNGRVFDEDACYRFLRIFTKINVLRKGTSNNGFERVGHIFMSGNSLAHFLAHNEIVKVKSGDIPFATDIDFITDKFWFKMKKGFGTANSVPRSFDVITKAQVVLSTQLTKKIASEYEKLSSKFNSGQLSKEDAIALNHNLRHKKSNPEDLNQSNLEETLSFLTEDSLEKYEQEKSALSEKLKEGELAKDELRKIRSAQWVKRKKPIKLKYKFLFWVFIALQFSLLISLSYLGYYLLMKYKGDDSILSLTFGIITILSVIIPMIKLKAWNRSISKKLKSNYQSQINLIAPPVAARFITRGVK